MNLRYSAHIHTCTFALPLPFIETYLTDCDFVATAGKGILFTLNVKKNFRK